MKTYSNPTTEIRSLVFNQIICASQAPAPQNSVTTGNEVLPENTIGD